MQIRIFCARPPHGVVGKQAVFCYVRYSTRLKSRFFFLESIEFSPD
jgi:hypothetical protein